jgi:hypothetical protein
VKSYFAALRLASHIMQMERNIAEGAKFTYIMRERFVLAAEWR